MSSWAHSAFGAAELGFAETLGREDSSLAGQEDENDFRFVVAILVALAALDAFQAGSFIVRISFDPRRFQASVLHR